MVYLFHNATQRCSRLITEHYSTSFSSAVRLLHEDLRNPIYNIYGFVRFADEIVDSFHKYDRGALLAEFREDTYAAIEKGISLNPVLNSFQITVNTYRIEKSLIGSFFKSMEMDLQKQEFDKTLYEMYIYGSAEVVGLMCLRVFCEGDENRYEKLKPYARSLGSAFQKVNFLRDISSDYGDLDRRYFPGFESDNFDNRMKRRIEEEITQEFKHAYEGIRLLPLKARFGVYVSYKYYWSLFRKIKGIQSSHILVKRIRIPNYRKWMILARAGLKNQLKLI